MIQAPVLLECELNNCRAESTHYLIAPDGGLVCCTSCAAFAQFLAVALGFDLDVQPLDAVQLDTGPPLADTAHTLELVEHSP